MNNFEDNIRNEINKFEYKYKFSYWKNFAKSAGFKTGLSTVQTALLAIGGSIAAAGIGYGTYSLTADSTKPLTTTQEIVAEISTVNMDNTLLNSDTTIFAPEMAATVDSSKSTPKQRKTSVPHPAYSATHSNNEPESASQTSMTPQKTESATSPQKTDTETERYNWRIIRINVDTIKSNQ